MTRFGRRAAATLTAGLLAATLLAGAVPAGAEPRDSAETTTTTTAVQAPVATTSPPTTAPTPTLPPTTAVQPIGVLESTGDGAAAFGQLQGRYRSLSANLIAYYAISGGADLDAFLAQNTPTIANLIGTTETTRISAMSANVGTEADPSILSERFSELGLAPDWDAVDSFDDMVAELGAHTTGLDARVISQSAQWANQLGALRAPQLAAPQLDPALAASVPAEGLVFGMFANRSLAALVADHPAVFDQVSTSGLGSTAQLDAWRKSMLNAGNALNTDLEGSLPSPCLSQMVTTMASGTAPAERRAGCDPCVVGGLYLNGQLGSIFDRAGNTFELNPADDFISDEERETYQPWLRDALDGATNRAGTDTARADGANSVRGCAGASAATRGTLNQTLPGVFGQLLGNG